MSVYVDPLVQHGIGSYHGAGVAQAIRVGRKHGHRWCHLFADTEQELVAFAVDKLGMRAAWLQRGHLVHFDLVPPRRVAAVAQGAVEVSRVEAVRIWQRLRGAR